jgi:hypothetical protein
MIIPPNGFSKGASALGRIHGRQTCTQWLATCEICFGYTAEQNYFISFSTAPVLAAPLDYIPIFEGENQLAFQFGREWWPAPNSFYNE